MRAVPFVFLLFPVYGLDRVGEVITYNKKELLSFSFFRNSGLVCRRKILDRRLTSRTRQQIALWDFCEALIFVPTRRLVSCVIR